MWGVTSASDFSSLRLCLRRVELGPVEGGSSLGALAALFPRGAVADGASTVGDMLSVPQGLSDVASLERRKQKATKLNHERPKRMCTFTLQTKLARRRVTENL